MAALWFYIRLFAAGVWFFVATFVSMLLLPFRWKDPSVGAIMGRIVHWGGCKIFGYKVRVDGMSKLYSSQPAIYVGNHQSNIDVVTMGCLYPYNTVVIGKKQLKWVPLFGLFYVGTGMIMIDRKSRTNSVAGLDQAKAAMDERGCSIWIFAEGTRNRGRSALLPFKKGAFHIAIRAQVPIVPIVHQHLYSYFDIANKRINNEQEILVRILDPVPTRGMTLDDLPKLMALVRSKMIEALLAPEMKVPEAQKAELLRET